MSSVGLGPDCVVPRMSRRADARDGKSEKYRNAVRTAARLKRFNRSVTATRLAGLSDRQPGPGLSPEGHGQGHVLRVVMGGPVQVVLGDGHRCIDRPELLPEVLVAVPFHEVRAYRPTGGRSSNSSN
jgi:hypothetical protein